MYVYVCECVCVPCANVRICVNVWVRVTVCPNALGSIEICANSLNILFSSFFHRNVCPSGLQLIDQSVSPSVHPSIHASVRLSVRPSVSVCPIIRSAVIPLDHPSVFDSVHPYEPSGRPSVFRSV